MTLVCKQRFLQEKLNYYLPIASEILQEIDLYLTKNDKDKIALSKYKDLRKSVDYANKYALVKGLKNSSVFEMNDGTIKGYKKDVLTKIHGGGARDRKRKLLDKQKK